MPRAEVSSVRVTRAAFPRRDGSAFAEEEPGEKREERDPRHDRGDAVRGHASLFLARRRLLPTTETDEAAMAAEAIMGESIQPVSG